MQQILNIINEKGLHARASAKFVEIVEQYDADVTVEKDGLFA
ncbi:MAG: HPr family phosphocarrier protein, partial [Pseudomonadota bacterium]